jgi:hypothetical protein
MKVKYYSILARKMCYFSLKTMILLEIIEVSEEKACNA